MSNASNNFPPFALGSVLVVDPTFGNDNTGQRGSMSQAFGSIPGAVGSSVAGDTILLAAGTHTVNTSILLKANQTLRGMGMNSTILNWTVDLVSQANKWVCIEVASGCFVGDLTVVCSLNGTNPEKFQAVIGAHTGWGGTGATDFIVRNLRGVGDSDVVYVRNGNLYKGEFYNCVFESNWDLIALQDGAHQIKCFDCKFKSTAPNTGGVSNPPHAVNTQNFSGGKVWIIGGYIELSGHASARVILDNDAVSTSSYFLNGVQVSNTAALDVNFAANGLTFEITGTNITPSRVSGAVSTGIVKFYGCPIDQVTTTARNTFSVDYAIQRGLIIYNTSIGQYQVWNGINWQSLGQTTIGRRTASVMASGSGAGSTVMGDAAVVAGTSSAIAPTATEGATRDEASSTTSGNPFGTSGNLNYRTGKNCYFGARIKLQQTTTERVWYGLTDLALGPTGSGMGSADAIAGNYAAFRYSSGTDTKFQCICMDGATQTVVNSNVTVDTAIHQFEIVFNDSVPNVQFYIDGVLVATITTHLPTASTNLRYIVGGNTSDVAVHDLRYEWIQVESDR